MTVDSETTTASGATTNIVIAPVYVCKKHEKGSAYISIDGVSFCSLCLKRFLERYLKPMTKLETKVVPVAAAVAVKETP